MKDQAMRRLSSSNSVMESVDGQKTIHFGGNAISDDLARKQIKDDTKIVKPASSAKVSKITHPNEIWFWLIEILSENIFAGKILRGMTRARRLYSAHFREIHGFHESVHSTDTDMDAIITLKTDLDFMRT